MQSINDIEDNIEDNDEFMSAVIDEIALEGLDGITLPTLWIRLRARYEAIDGQPNKRLDFTTDSVQNFIFEYIVKSLTIEKTVSMYLLPEKRPTITLYNRYDYINEETGTLIEDSDVIPIDIYGEVTPITDQKVRGSSANYYERKNITKDVMDNKMTIEDIDNNFGSEKFVLVADQSRRTEALMGSYIEPNIELTAIQYCILERVGRQRYLGEITIGKESGNYKLSAKTLFYYRKLLLKKNLIKKKQTILFNKKTVQNSHGLVFTLNRFTKERHSISELNAIKITNLLLKSDGNQLDYDYVRNQLDIKAKHFRDLLHSFSTNFRVSSVDTTKDANGSTNKSNSNKRLIRLLKPFGEDVEENEPNEDNEDDDEECSISGNKSHSLNVLNPGKILADRTLLAQALAVIESHESNGIPLLEVGRCLSLPKLEARSIVRALEKTGLIMAVMVDRGRQKVTHFVPKFRNQTDFSGPNRLIASSSPKELNETTKNFLNRANLILDFVRREQLVDRIFSLKQLIREKEKNNEYKICTKTVVRIINKLAGEGLVRSIRTFLKYQDRVKKLHFVCIPSITAEHPLVKDKINQMKFQWIGHNLIDIQSDKCQPPIGHNLSPLAESLAQSNPVMYLIYQPSIARKYGLEPKMKKILTLYRFLFYLTYDCNKQNIPNTDWRYNIEPLAEGTDSKMCSIGQIVPRMPVSVFVKIVWISHIIPGLQEILDDPIKRHLTLSQISPIILDCLRYKRKYVFNICEGLVGLTYLGLVETQYKEQTEKEKTLIVVKNKFSLVVNKIKRDFELKTMKDLQDFEGFLQMHCFEACNDCSLDKRLFAHNLRNWTYTPSYKTKSVLPSNRFSTISGNNQTIGKQKENKRKRKQSSGNSSKSPKKVKPNEKSAENVGSESAQNGKHAAVEKQTVPTQKRKKSRQKAYDKIDLKAKSLLKKQRTDWTPEEDSFLLICKVVSALLDPQCAHHICVNRNVIRDELHKYYPKVSSDKTALACGRRISYMLKNPTTRQNVFDYIGEFKQQVVINRPTVPRTQEQVWSEVYIKLLHDILNRMQSSHQKNSDNRTTISMNSVEELVSRFNIVKTPSSVLSSRGRLYEDPNNVVDIHVNVVTNVLLSSLLSKLYFNQTNDKSDTNSWFSQTLFRIYQRFPDSLIRSVVTKLNKYGVMTKVKKTTKENLSSLKSKGGTTPYRVSQNFLFLMQTKYCLESLLMDYNLNEELICIKNGKTGFDAAVVTSLFASKSVRFVTEIPENIVVLQNDCPLFTTARNAVKNPKDPKTTSRYALYLLRQHMNNNGTDRIQHSSDYLNINQCRITCTATDPFVLNVHNLDDLFKSQKRIFTNDLSSNQIHCYLEDKPLFDFISSKREMGASIEELLRFKTQDLLNQSLKRLNEQNLVFRVGIRSFRWVSIDHMDPWLVRSQVFNESEKTVSITDQTYIKFFARYWKQPNGTVDLRVVYKFLSAVLGHIMTNPCIPEEKLIEYFDQSLQPVQLLEIIEMLITSKCIEVLESSKISEPKLFDPKPDSLDIKIRHYYSTPDCIIRLHRMKDYFRF